MMYARMKRTPSEQPGCKHLWRERLDTDSKELLRLSDREITQSVYEDTRGSIGNNSAFYSEYRVGACVPRSLLTIGNDSN